ERQLHDGLDPAGDHGRLPQRQPQEEQEDQRRQDPDQDDPVDVEARPLEQEDRREELLEAGSVEAPSLCGCEHRHRWQGVGEQGGLLTAMRSPLLRRPATALRSGVVVGLTSDLDLAMVWCGPGIRGRKTVAVPVVQSLTDYSQLIPSILYQA